MRKAELTPCTSGKNTFLGEAGVGFSFSNDQFLGVDMLLNLANPNTSLEFLFFFKL